MCKTFFTRITIFLFLLCAIITPVSAYAITYYVKFNPNGGSGTMSNQTFTTDEEKYLTTNAFTRTGYNFIGWNSNSGGTGTWYMPSKKVKNLTTTSGATVDVYAQWMQSNQSTIKIGTTEVTKDSGGNYNIDNHKNYTVQVNVVNGTVNTSSKSVEYYTDATFTVTAGTGANNPTVSCTNSQSGSLSGNTLTVASVSNNTVCTVTYQMIPYTLTADANNGSMSTTSGWTISNTSYPIYGATLSGDLEEQIDGNANADSVANFRNSYSNNIPTTLNGKKVIIIGDRDGIPNYAIERVLNNTGAEIIYSYNSAFVSDATGTLENNVQQDIIDKVDEYGSSNIVAILGSSDAEGSEIYAETLTLGDPTFTGPLSEVSLYLPVYHVFESFIKDQADTSKWNQYITNSIPRDSTTGYDASGTKVVTYGSTYGTLPTPTRDGYTFGGWYTSMIGGTQVTSSSVYNLTTDSTIYAHWNCIGLSNSNYNTNSTIEYAGMDWTVVSDNGNTVDLAYNSQVDGNGTTTGDTGGTYLNAENAVEKWLTTNTTTNAAFADSCLVNNGSDSNNTTNGPSVEYWLSDGSVNVPTTVLHYQVTSATYHQGYLVTTSTGQASNMAVTLNGTSCNSYSTAFESGSTATNGDHAIVSNSSSTITYINSSCQPGSLTTNYYTSAGYTRLRPNTSEHNASSSSLPVTGKSWYPNGSEADPEKSFHAQKRHYYYICGTSNHSKSLRLDANSSTKYDYWNVGATSASGSRNYSSNYYYYFAGRTISYTNSEGTIRYFNFYNTANNAVNCSRVQTYVISNGDAKDIYYRPFITVTKNSAT